MKKSIRVAVLLTALVATGAQAQSTNGSGSGTKAATTYGARSTRNDQTGPGKSGGNTTIDGSDGSATNDGASGMSGRPAPLPAMAADRSTLRATSHANRKTKRSTTTSRSSSTTASRPRP